MMNKIRFQYFQILIANLSPAILVRSPPLIWFESSTHNAAYKCQWTGTPMVQVMACRLFIAKPLPELMLAYCNLDSSEHIPVKFEIYHFHWRKNAIENVVGYNSGHFVQMGRGRDELTKLEHCEVITEFSKMQLLTRTLILVKPALSSMLV